MAENPLIQEISQRANADKMCLRSRLAVYSMDKRWLRLPNEEPLSSSNYRLDEADKEEVEVISRDEFVVMTLVDLKLSNKIDPDLLSEQLNNSLMAIKALVIETVTNGMSTGILLDKLQAAMKIHQYTFADVVPLNPLMNGLRFEQLEPRSCRAMNRLV